MHRENSGDSPVPMIYDGKKRIDSALLPVLAFPFSRFPVFPFRDVVVNVWESEGIYFYYNI